MTKKERAVYLAAMKFAACFLDGDREWKAANVRWLKGNYGLMAKLIRACARARKGKP